MMHVFYCLKCKKYRFTNNQSRAVCCGQTMKPVNMPFTEFVKMDRKEREEYLQLYMPAK